MTMVLLAILLCVVLTRGEERLENKLLSHTKADGDIRAERSSDSTGILGNYFTIGGHGSYGLQQNGGIQNIFDGSAYGVLESNKNIGGLNLDGGMILSNNFGVNLFGGHDFGLNSGVSGFHNFQGNGDYLHSIGAFGLGGYEESYPRDLSIGKHGLQLFNIGSTGLPGYRVGGTDNIVQNFGVQSVGAHGTFLDGFGSHVLGEKFGGYKNGGLNVGEDKIRGYSDHTVAMAKIPVDQSVSQPDMQHETEETVIKKEEQKSPLSVPLPVKISPPNTIKTTMMKMVGKTVDEPSEKQVPYTLGKLLSVDAVKQIPYTISNLHHMYLYNHNV